MRRRAAITASALGVLSAVAPTAVRAFDADEHSHVWDVAMAPMPAELRARLRDPIRLQVYTSASAGPASLVPVPFAVADRIATRERTISQLTQLPDLSYAIWDWASGNQTCPINGPGASVSLSATACHEYNTHLGPLNSTHFLPQARLAYQRLHRAAVTKAYHCADTRGRLAGAPARLASYANDCDLEAFAFEAVAHHFLQDAFSTGHMWQRWGGPNPDAFGGGLLLGTDRVALQVAAVTGIIHGARAVLEGLVPDVYWPDPLSGPIDVVRFPIDGVLNPVQYVQGTGANLSIRPGVGDVYVSLMETDYRWQYDQMLDCARRSIHEVGAAAGLPVADVSALPDTASQSFLDRCFGNRVTNESMLLGYALDGIRGTTHLRVPLDDVAGTVVVSVVTGGPVAEDVRLGRDLAVIGNVIRTEVATNPFGTNLADGGLPPLLGVAPNGLYASEPLSRYADPELPLTLTFGGGLGAVEPSNIIGRAFHRAHARDWCGVATSADLETLRGNAGSDAAAAAARCEICVEIGGRHVRIGKNAADYDRSKEPLCAYLVDGAAFVYVDTDSGDPLEASRRWCGCDAGADGGRDGPTDGSLGGDGAGAGGASGGGNPGQGGDMGGGNPGTGAGPGTGASPGNPGGGGATGAAGNSAGGATGMAGANGGAGTNGNGGGQVPPWGYLPPAFDCMGEGCMGLDGTPPGPFPWWGSPPDPPPADPDSWWDKNWGDFLDWLGGLWGDPHLVTLDGLMVGFQAIGEFVFIDDGANLQVQVRQSRWGSSETVAGLTALAARVGGHRVMFDATQPTLVRIDGAPVAVAAELALSGGGSIVPMPGAYLVRWPGGEEMHVRMVYAHLDALLRMPRTAGRRFVGLLGDGDGDLKNDLALRDGTVLPQPVRRADLYTSYADSWRVAQAESLFDYPPGLGTADFTDRGFPSKAASAGLLSPAEHAGAMKACSDHGVVMPAMLNACTLDYALTKDLSVVRAYQGTPAPLAVNPSVDYRNDFERDDLDAAWGQLTIGEVPAPARLGPNRFAGPFTDGPVSFSLTALPAHTTVTVAFDLYVIGGWSGEVWSLRDSANRFLLSASFDNLGGQQSYPDAAGLGGHPSRSGASLIDALSARDSGIPDAVYHQRFTFAHTGNLALTFIGPPAGSDPGVRWGLDNVEVLLDTPTGVSTTTVGSVTMLHGPVGAPDVVGCADGRREAFIDRDRYPNIAGCQATWSGRIGMRTPPVGTPCGDELGACATPADACAPGWRLCGVEGAPADLSARISADDCDLAGPGVFLAAMSHCNGPSSTCGYADDPGETLVCFNSGWCSEPICCGANCAYGGCRDGVWRDRTHPSPLGMGCGNTAAPNPGGVMCCR